MTDERAIEDRIRARAHEIWEREGQPEGEDLRHWDEARLEIESEERVSTASGSGETSDAALANPVGGTEGAPDVLPEAGQGAPNDDLGGETEASPSQLDRTPM
jgi:hypothetical protein